MVGPSGAGKTTFGLQFLSASSASEPGLLFGCYEPPERLRLKAETMGLDLAAAEQRGEWRCSGIPWASTSWTSSPIGCSRRFGARGVKRLVIDGMSGFQQAALEPERMVRFWSALSNELRALGVTTLHTLEMPELMGPSSVCRWAGSPRSPRSWSCCATSSFSRGCIRLISLFKVREGAFDPTIREFAITDAGIVVGKPFEGVEAVLSGMAREAAEARPLLLRPKTATREPSRDRTGQSG